ncbi:MAG: hypothetical protein KatS3mg109_1963 [Pirellulaceae bacterium]|nr:MAG: hypothetical protein KatS3mg109_1963 [Pirellulaceae bacterium]
MRIPNEKFPIRRPSLPPRRTRQSSTRFFPFPYRNSYATCWRTSLACSATTKNPVAVESQGFRINRVRSFAPLKLRLSPVNGAGLLKGKRHRNATLLNAQAGTNVARLDGDAARLTSGTLAREISYSWDIGTRLLAASDPDSNVSVHRHHS